MQHSSLLHGIFFAECCIKENCVTKYCITESCIKDIGSRNIVSRTSGSRNIASLYIASLYIAWLCRGPRNLLYCCRIAELLKEIRLELESVLGSLTFTSISVKLTSFQHSPFCFLQSLIQIFFFANLDQETKKCFLLTKLNFF